jgi:hypothetical protein
LELKLSANHKTLSSASETFSLDYNDLESANGVSSIINQFESFLLDSIKRNDWFGSKEDLIITTHNILCKSLKR